MFIGKYNKSVILTYIGVMLSFAGTAFTLNNRLAAAMICLILSGICDLFDGVIARKCKRSDLEKEFGVQIDSLADVVNFLTLPAVLGLRLMSGIGMVKYPIIITYILCGIIRLAWFNTSAATEETRTHYDGLPVTYSALILPILWTILRFTNSSGELTTAVIWALSYFITAVMFILNVKISKPRGVWYGIFGILAVVVISLIVFKDIL